MKPDSSIVEDLLQLGLDEMAAAWDNATSLNFLRLVVNNEQENT